eukprot:GHVT01005163.1.p1 GENE.GHVT01005163.1~~GHVT01005163.1.p1  ORF type:complete len:328 (+),score=47.16 GHVT01005163.1:2237-3220(+)
MHNNLLTNLESAAVVTPHENSQSADSDKIGSNDTNDSSSAKCPGYNCLSSRGLAVADSTPQSWSNGKTHDNSKGEAILGTECSGIGEAVAEDDALVCFAALETLFVNENHLSNLCGIEKFPGLVRLYMAHQCGPGFCSLSSSPCLSCLPRLRYLDISFNHLDSLSAIAPLVSLEFLDARCNVVESFQEGVATMLVGVHKLAELKLHGNPVTSARTFWSDILAHAPDALMRVDDKQITSKQRESVKALLCRKKASVQLADNNNNNDNSNNNNNNNKNNNEEAKNEWSEKRDDYSDTRKKESSCSLTARPCFNAQCRLAKKSAIKTFDQ